MIIENDQQLAAYQEAGKISTEILDQLRQAVKAGATGLELDQLADKLCAKHQVRPNFKGVGAPANPYQHATCVSVNDTVVHGIPDDRPFEPGDVVKVDFGIEYQGLNTDHCFTVGVGKLKPSDHNLVSTAKKAIEKAASQAVAGNRTGDLGFIIQSTANRAGLTVAKEFVGHGIGSSLHDEPQIPGLGQPNTGQVLKKGMVLCVEAQILAGKDEVYIESDGWTVKTMDGKNAAMFEYMVVVGQKKPIYLTPTQDWGIISR
ncbi:MAG: type I methionyl aminopeptidase [Candidatus Pacebacteria bacterium]|nr:type I methionyl aminopeptidase [Candidatus Paceibacterota bacterium]